MKTSIVKVDKYLFKCGNVVTDGEAVVMITETADLKDLVFSGVVIHEETSDWYIGMTNINFEKGDFDQFNGTVNFEA